MADIADAVVVQQVHDADPTPERIKTAVHDLLAEGGMEQMRLRKFKKLLASKLSVTKMQVDVHHELVKTCVRGFWATSVPDVTPTQRMAALVEALGGEAENSKQRIHFVTVARVLPDTLDATDFVDVTGMTRQQKLNSWSIYHFQLFHVSA
jgi:hypothetical protein